MFMVSREMGSWPLMVIFTVRRAVFIWGETEEIVPWMMVPENKLARYCIPPSSRNKTRAPVPFFNSIVTVSLAHFIRNL